MYRDTRSAPRQLPILLSMLNDTCSNHWINQLDRQVLRPLPTATSMWFRTIRPKIMDYDGIVLAPGAFSVSMESKRGARFLI